MKISKLLVLLLCCFACSKPIDFTKEKILILKSSQINQTTNIESYDIQLNKVHSKKINNVAIGIQTLPLQKYKDKFYDIAYKPNNNKLVEFNLKNNKLLKLKRNIDYPLYKKVIKNTLFSSSNTLEDNKINIINLNTKRNYTLNINHYFVNEIAFKNNNTFLFVTNIKDETNELLTYNKKYKLINKLKLAGNYNANSSALLIGNNIYSIFESKKQNYLYEYNIDTLKVKKIKLKNNSPAKIIYLNNSLLIPNYDTFNNSDVTKQIEVIDINEYKYDLVKTSKNILDIYKYQNNIFALTNNSIIKYSHNFKELSETIINKKANEEIIGFIK